MSEALLQSDETIDDLVGLTLSATINRHWRNGLTSAEIAKKVGLPEADVERIRVGDRDRDVGGPRTVLRQRLPFLILPAIQVIQEPVDG